MNNLLDRLRKLPRSTQILGAVLGLVLLGTVGYLVFFPPVPPVPDVVLTPTPQPTQPQPAQPQPTPPTDSATLKPLEAPGIPFLANQSPSTPEASENGEPGTAVVATPVFRTPPNPFAPLDPPVTDSIAVSNPPTPAPIAPTPIPTTSTTVVVQQPNAPLPSTPVQPTIPAAQPRLSPVSAQPAIQLPSQVAPSRGALPLTINPIDRQAAVVPPPPPPPVPDTTATTNTGGSNGSSNGSNSGSTTPAVPEPPASPLTQLIQQRSLKLTGVALGPTGVAIISSLQGDIVVSVGERIPGTDALLKSLEARQAVLALGEETQTLKLEGGD